MTQPKYYKALWHNCNLCHIHYMSEQPHIRAYLCDDCWNKTPQFVVANKPKENVTVESPMSDWPIVWIALYTVSCIGLMMIIGYYLVFHG